jgi:hypothetical protein
MSKTLAQIASTAPAETSLPDTAQVDEEVT